MVGRHTTASGQKRTGALRNKLWQNFIEFPVVLRRELMMRPSSWRPSIVPSEGHNRQFSLRLASS
jgi:hypothetical protein